VVRVANRSYLYAANRVPERPQDVPESVVGLMEWPNDVPLVQRLLLSGDPVVCPSMIFGVEDRIGIVADHDTGFAALFDFLDRLEHAAAAPLATAARAILGEPGRPGAVIIAEAGEIFDMDGRELADAAALLVARIRDHLPMDVRTALTVLNGLEPDEAALRELGLGAWSSVLWYDLMR